MSAPLPSASHDPLHSPVVRARIAAVIVLVVLVASLAQTLGAPLLYDDTSIIRDNGWLRGWGVLARVWTQPYWPTAGADTMGLYRPLHIALLAVVWNATGGSPFAFHLYALLLAAATSLAVWWLARQALAFAVALAAAAWFAAHPLHVEAVASVANSSDLLVALCTVALVPLLRSRDAAGATGTRSRTALVPLLAAAALLSKESGLLALPVALVTTWGWHPAGMPRESFVALCRRNRVALVLAATAVGVTLLARHLVLDAAVAQHAALAQGLPTDAVDRVVAMLALWPRIAGMLVWPTVLLPYYGASVLPANAIPLALASVVGALLLAAFAIRAARRGDARHVVALTWIALTYLPASNLLFGSGQILSDRVLFGATVGVALGVAALADALLRGAGLRARTLLLAAMTVLVLHAMVTSIRYSLAWTSHRALWTHLVHHAPAEHLGYKLLGMDARGRGQPDSAIVFLARAQRMAPSDRQIRFELGQAYFGAGRFAESVSALAPLLRDGDARAEPGFVALYLEAVGRAAGAQAVVDAARPLADGRSSSAATAALFLGLAYERIGQPAAADAAYRSGLTAAPGDAALRDRIAALRAAGP